MRVQWWKEKFCLFNLEIFQSHTQNYIENINIKIKLFRPKFEVSIKCRQFHPYAFNLLEAESFFFFFLF